MSSATNRRGFLAAVVAAIVGAWYQLRRSAGTRVARGPGGPNESVEEPVEEDESSPSWLTILSGKTVRLTGGGIGYHEGVEWEEDGKLVLEEDAGFGLLEDTNE